MKHRDLDLLVRVRQDPELSGEFSWYGYSNLVEVRSRYEADGYLGEHGGLLIVDTGHDEGAGFVSWHRVSHGPGEGSQCWNIGVFLVPNHRGHGIGAQAQRQLAEHLLATTPLARVEAATDAANIAEQRALEKAGFTREGTLRRAQFRSGTWHDVILFSRLRDEWTYENRRSSTCAPKRWRGRYSYPETTWL